MIKSKITRRLHKEVVIEELREVAKELLKLINEEMKNDNMDLCIKLHECESGVEHAIKILIKTQ